MEDVSLVKVDRDERLKLGSLDLCQFLCRHVDERIKDLLEVVISRLHDLLVAASVLESIRGSCCPYYLKTQQPDLKVRVRVCVNVVRMYMILEMAI